MEATVPDGSDPPPSDDVRAPLQIEVEADVRAEAGKDVALTNGKTTKRGLGGDAENRHPGNTGCPVIDGFAIDEYRAAIKASNRFSQTVLTHLNAQDDQAQADWLKEGIQYGRELFQPWSMEILYVTAVRGTVRFSDLMDLLGMSSRTLSTKLKTLKQAGFLDRHVHDEHPVRIEYTLTKHGRTIAALASPLFCAINQHCIEAGTKDEGAVAKHAGMLG